MISTFFKNMTRNDVTQIYHAGHKALDIDGNETHYGYGTPLCAPEMCLVLGITDEGPKGSEKELANGYGISLKGLETGMTYLYWHCLPMFPVHGGDTVKRGQIVAFMGNAGPVTKWGKTVPLSERTKTPFAGTHVHVQVEKDGKRLDPLPLINFNWQPQYTTADYLVAMIAVFKKILKKL